MLEGIITNEWRPIEMILTRYQYCIRMGRGKGVLGRGISLDSWLSTISRCDRGDGSEAATSAVVSVSECVLSEEFKLYYHDPAAAGSHSDSASKIARVLTSLQQVVHEALVQLRV